MEHIKTPVRIGGYDAGDYISIQEADGSYEQTMQGMAEIVQAVNVYAALVAQRDALVAALEMAAFELDSIIDQKGHTGLTRDIRDAAYNALALAKGGTSE